MSPLFTLDPKLRFCLFFLISAVSGLLCYLSVQAWILSVSDHGVRSNPAASAYTMLNLGLEASGVTAISKLQLLRHLYTYSITQSGRTAKRSWDSDQRHGQEWGAGLLARSELTPAGNFRGFLKL